jgi:universal stress protein A
MAVQHILVPIDFSDFAIAAAHEAVSLAKVFDASITLLHVHEIESLTVMDFSYVESPESMTKACEAAEKSINALAQKLDRSPATIAVKVLTGPAVKTIINESQQHDMVIMGTHGRTGLAHMLIGSVAERVVRGAHCSVLVVRKKT